MFKVTEFEEDNYYLLMGSGDKWSDYDGPFKNIKEAIDHMANLCGKWASPEMINSAVLTFFKNNALDLVKDDNGSPINGNKFYWKETIVKDNVLLWSNDK
jgi:hypothetical protein